MRLLITGICGFVGATLARGFRESWPALEKAWEEIAGRAEKNPHWLEVSVAS